MDVRVVYYVGSGLCNLFVWAVPSPFHMCHTASSYGWPYHLPLSWPMLRAFFIVWSSFGVSAPCSMCITTFRKKTGWLQWFKFMFNVHHISVIVGFRHEVDESCAFLGYYAAFSGNSLPKFRDNPSFPSSRVKNLAWPLMMGPIGCPEVSVRNCRYTLRNIAEERSSYLHNVSY